MADQDKQPIKSPNKERKLKSTVCSMNMLEEKRAKRSIMLMCVYLELFG